MIRVNIAGHWEPSDFIDILESIESLYYIALVKRDTHLLYAYDDRYIGDPVSRYASYDSYLDAANRWLLDRARRLTPTRNRLYIKKIEFASPGGIDFAGIGQATEAVDRVVGRLISFFTERKLRREKVRQAELETEMMRQSLNAVKIDNARKLLELRRDFPAEEHLLALAVRDQDRIADRIAQGLITGRDDTDDS